MGERQWSEAELTVARAASSVPRPGEGAWLNAGTFSDYWQQVARAVIEALGADGRQEPTEDQLQLDLATAIARIMQAYKEPPMREFLLWRLYECDVPRLSEYLNDESLALLSEVGRG